MGEGKACIFPISLPISGPRPETLEPACKAAISKVRSWAFSNGFFVIWLGLGGVGKGGGEGLGKGRKFEFFVGDGQLEAQMNQVKGLRLHSQSRKILKRLRVGR